MAMHKQVVSLTGPQFNYLYDKAKRLDVSIAEVVRRIIDEHRAREEDELRRIARGASGD